MGYSGEGQVLEGRLGLNTPSYEFQLRFLSYIQRLLDEGVFSATYKYALLMALADIAIECGSDDDSELEIGAKLIAEKFVRYYWRQTKPFVAGGGNGADVLLQNSGPQAHVVNIVTEARVTYTVLPRPGDPGFSQLINDVAATVRMMPLWKLQVIGQETVDFLYPNVGRGSLIALRPGIAFCFRRFHSLIRRLAQDGWIRFVRERRRNQQLMGDNLDLGAFLFGTDRENLNAYRPLLREIQSNTCFYCGRDLNTSEVDHFIPWSRYPHDLGHNFVLSCRACNNAKRDMLAAQRHVEKWALRNEDHGRDMAKFFDKKKLVHDCGSSVTISRWAYSQALSAGARGWIWQKETEMLTEEVLKNLNVA